MRQAIKETGKWIPLLFYNCNYRQLGLGARLWLPVQWFVRSLLHIFLYFVLLVIFAAVLIVGFVTMLIMLPLTLSFWETQIGAVLLYTLIVITALVPSRLTRYPSYILFSKIFRSRGLFFS